MILASTSPRRQQLLHEAGLGFRVVALSFDEGALKQAGLPPAELTQRLAQGKARSVAAQARPHEVIVASDTVVVLDGEVLGKPRDAGEARRMLTRLSGREHEVLSAVCLLRDTDERTFCERTAVSFYDLADEEIDAYVGQRRAHGQGRRLRDTGRGTAVRAPHRGGLLHGGGPAHSQARARAARHGGARDPGRGIG